MKRLTKITFTVTTEEAQDISKAIHFLHIGCTKATAKNPKGIAEINSENMKALDMDEQRLDRLIAFRTWINEEIADLDAWNAEVDHFENISSSALQ
jgi:hypothetical protein